MEKSGSADLLFSVYLLVLALSGTWGSITVSPSSPVKVDESAGISTLTVTNNNLPGTGYWGFTSSLMDETTSAGLDYTARTSIIHRVPVTLASIRLVVRITDDKVLDPFETFLLRITDSFLGESDVNVTICIIDNEPLPPGFSGRRECPEAPPPPDVKQTLENGVPVELKQPGNITVKEGQSNNNITLTLERADASTRNFTVHVQIQAGTAVPDQDIAHEGIEKWFEFAENETSKTIPLASLINDLIEEPSEVFTVVITGPDLKDNITVHVTIKDNDIVPVELKQPGNITVKEGQSNNNITLTLERADASTRNFTVHVQIQAGTAVPEQDIAHEGIEKWFEFAENETSKTIPLASLINDLIEEPSEVFTVVITGPDLKDNITVHVTIKDDDSVITIITNPPDPFHCGRGKSQPCLNNGTCTDEGCHPSTGYCDCTSGFSGVNCGIDDTLPTCNQACVNGTCVNGACICDPGFAGELCDKNAYYHQCNPTNFSVCITPFSLDTFSGAVYVKNFQNVSKCNLTLAPSPAVPSDGIVDWCKGYATAIPYNGTCGELGPTVDGNYTSYELELLVQYTSGIKSCTDEKVTFTCRYDNNSLHIVNTYDTNSFHDGSVVRETANYVPAILTSTAADGSSLTQPLALGTTVKICISVKEIPGLDGIVIHKITVHNNRPIPDKRSITLYDKGCIPDTAAGILTVSPFFIPTGEKHTICFAIRIFVFEHDIYLAHPVLAVKVYFQVLRHDALAGAVLPTCGSRKKRQTDDDERSLSTTFTITITDGGENAVRTSLDRSTDNKSVMVPIVVGLGSLAIAIAVAVVATAVGFIISKRRRRSKLTKKDDLSHSSR